MKLTDWIIQQIEKPMEEPTRMILAIPEGVQFSDLALARDPDGGVSFDWAPIERICEANGMDISPLRDGPEDNVASMLTAWYRAHLDTGGSRDAVFEDLIGEVQLENALGQFSSHAPGRA